MRADPIRGKTIRWTFSDGPMAKKTFEHTFAQDGGVTFRSFDGGERGKPTRVAKCEVATVGENVHAVSYLGPSGYTLTTVLDFRVGRLVAFASNEQGITVQNGTFEPVDDAAKAPSRPVNVEEAHAPRAR